MRKTLFDSTAEGIIRYFVRPNDDFVLNSLEKLDCDEYLYRLLREEGYKRVIFCEQGTANIDVYAYDKLSHLSFMNPLDFKNIDIDDEEALESAFEKIEDRIKTTKGGLKGINSSLTVSAPTSAADKCAEYGKRCIYHVVKSDKTGDSNSGTFLDFFHRYASPALQSENIKTAVVAQLDMTQLENAVDEIRVCEKNNRTKENILIFTTTRRANLEFFVSRSNAFKNIHSWLPELVSQATNPADRADRAIRFLQNYGCIVIADSVGEDEIANLILRKKYIECDSRFDEISVGKIYGLAGMLKTHLLQGAKMFSSLPYREVKEYIRTLNVYLNDDAYIDELKRTADGISRRNVNRMAEPKSVYVERVTNETLEYAETPYEEQENLYRLAMNRLDSLVGLQSVKDMLNGLFEMRAAFGDDGGPGHYVFAGNPGTGKTVVARLMGEIFKSQGLLKSGHVVEVRENDLVAGYVGQSAAKTREVCERAMDGVLFFDEAYSLVNTEPTGEKFKNSFAEDAYVELMAQMENNRKRLCVICAGYSDKMRLFVSANSGMKDRITRVIEFPDYSEEELLEIFKKMASDEKTEVDPEALPKLKDCIRRLISEGGEEFGNARAMRKLLRDCKENISSRLSARVCRGLDKYVITEADIPGMNKDEAKENGEKAYAALDELIGLTGVKQTVRSLANSIQLSAKRKQTVAPGHYVFSGNPGTGKTEVARLFSAILHSFGALSKGHVVEVDRSALVAGYVGQTAIKTENKCSEALGGVLFVDEAYTLFETNPGADFGTEALDTIMKYMEDHRSDLTVIFAGYRDKMEQLMSANAGFASRISDVIDFPDYSADELAEILRLMARKSELRMTPEFEEGAARVFEGWIRAKGEGFGNARDVRKFLEKASSNLANRLMQLSDFDEEANDSELDLLTEADIPESDKTVGSEGGSSSAHHKYSRIKRSVFESVKPPFGVDDYHNSESKLRALVKPAILFIKTDKGTGTGFLISPDGYAITCDHVIADASWVTARLGIPGNPETEEYVCHVINTKPTADMALIRLNGPSFPYLHIADEHREIVDGEEFSLSGYPLGENEDVTTYTGVIANEKGFSDETGMQYFFIQGEAKKGNSGSPLVSVSDGRVIGILTGSTIDEHDEMNKMRPIKYFWEEFLM